MIIRDVIEKLENEKRVLLDENIKLKEEIKTLKKEKIDIENKLDSLKKHLVVNKDDQIKINNKKTKKQII